MVHSLRKAGQIKHEMIANFCGRRLFGWAIDRFSRDKNACGHKAARALQELVREDPLDRLVGHRRDLVSNGPPRFYCNVGFVFNSFFLLRFEFQGISDDDLYPVQGARS